jgi:hypothetical protein
MYILCPEGPLILCGGHRPRNSDLMNASQKTKPRELEKSDELNRLSPNCCSMLAGYSAPAAYLQQSQTDPKKTHLGPKTATPLPPTATHYQTCSNSKTKQAPRTGDRDTIPAHCNPPCPNSKTQQTPRTGDRDRIPTHRHTNHAHALTQTNT